VTVGGAVLLGGTAEDLARWQEIDGFDETNLDCASNTYSRVLRGYGLDARVLGDQWGYRYAPGAGLPLERLMADRRDPPDVLFDWYGTREWLAQHDGPADVWQHVRSMLDEGRPPIVVVDICSFRTGSFFQGTHSPHRVVVVGYRGNEVLVLDGYGRSRFHGWLPTTEINPSLGPPELAAGWWRYDARFVVVDLPRPEPDAPGVTAERVRAALAVNVEEYLNPPDLPGETAGHVAAARFLADFRETSAGLGDAAADVVIPGIAQLAYLATQRKLNAQFLELAAELVSPHLAEQAAAFHRMSREWNKMFHTLLFGHRIGRPLGALLHGMSDRVGRTLEEEYERVSSLRDIG
jgi:hypothetical protein